MPNCMSNVSNVEFQKQMKTQKNLFLPGIPASGYAALTVSGVKFLVDCNIRKTNKKDSVGNLS